MPNASDAVVAIEKLRDYCLSATHPRGKHKARVFRAVLRLTARDAEELQLALLAAAAANDAEEGIMDQFGSRYTVDFDFIRGDVSARIRSSWIIRRGELAPRFVTCFIL